MTELTYQHKETLGEALHVIDEHTFFDDIVPTVVTEVIQSVAAEFGSLPPVYIPLRKDDYGVYGWPADGIEEKIRADGGSIQHGWRIREWPDVLLTAEPHAVWVDPDGTLVDITLDVAGGDTSLFVPVARYPEPFGSEQRPPTRYRVLHTVPDRSEAVAERIARMKSGQRAYEDRRAQKAGKTLEEWTLDKYYHDPLPGQIAKFIAACDAFDARLSTLPSLIVIDPDAPEQERPWSFAQDGADDVVAAPDATGAMADDDAGGEREEAAPVESGLAAEVEPDPLAATAIGMLNEDEADDDDAIDDLEEPFDVTWYAADNLYQWSTERDICRAAILRTLFG